MAEQETTGRIVITLEEYRLQHGYSKNSIAQGARMERTQLQNYLKNNVARVDLGVLARLCHYLHCDLSDIMHYEPNE